MRTAIRYAKSGDINIAYQVTGEGPRDIVLIPGFVSHLELDWAEPNYAHFLDRLGTFSRLIRFDKRGTGLSDRPGGLPDLEARMDDVRAVMDAVDSERAVLFGYSEGGPMAILYAATYPARVDALVLYGSYAKRIRSDDYRWAPTAEERLRYGEQLESDWGLKADMQRMCPSADEAMSQWWGNRARAAASPGSARKLIEMNSRVDVRDILPAVRVPTLVMHRRGDRDSYVDEGRYIAERIEGARFVALDGEDHFPAVNPDQILDEVEAFITGYPSRQSGDRMLATILFVDIVESTRRVAALGDRDWSSLLRNFHDTMAGLVARHRGQRVKTMGDGFLATFDGPARAVHCGNEVCHETRQFGLVARCGVHTAEIEKHGDDIAGIGVHVGARVSELADPGEVWVTRTVRDLVAGSGLKFEPRGTHTLKGVDETWEIYAATA